MSSVLSRSLKPAFLVQSEGLVVVKDANTGETVLSAPSMRHAVGECKRAGYYVHSIISAR